MYLCYYRIVLIVQLKLKRDVLHVIKFIIVLKITNEKIGLTTNSHVKNKQ